MHISKRGTAWPVLAVALLVAGCGSGDSDGSSAARSTAVSSTGSSGGGAPGATSSPTAQSRPPTLPGGGVLVTDAPPLPQTRSAAPTTQAPGAPYATVTTWVTAMRDADAGAPQRPDLDSYRGAFNFLLTRCREKPEEIKAYVMRIAPASTQDAEGKHYWTLTALGAMHAPTTGNQCVQVSG
ncbi:hypothetical protein ACWGR4_24465 [Embleya sp. NPDC055664]